MFTCYALPPYDTIPSFFLQPWLTQVSLSPSSSLSPATEHTEKQTHYSHSLPLLPHSSATLRGVHHVLHLLFVRPLFHSSSSSTLSSFIHLPTVSRTPIPTSDLLTYNHFRQRAQTHFRNFISMCVLHSSFVNHVHRRASIHRSFIGEDLAGVYPSAYG